MRWPDWSRISGLGERRWKKAPDEEVQPSKTVWDWLQLLIVPAMLAAIAVAYNAAQASREHHREDRAERDATLLAYFTQEGDLMLKGQLLPSHPESAAAEVARTITLATVHRLDGLLKADVVRFLSEAQLIEFDSPVVRLQGADLRHLNLVDAALLANVSFAEANLRGARFDGASLIHVKFAQADLRGASFRGASRGSVDFTLAKLNGAVFDGAKIGRSNDDPASPSRRSSAPALATHALSTRTSAGGRTSGQYRGIASTSAARTAWSWLRLGLQI